MDKDIMKFSKKQSIKPYFISIGILAELKSFLSEKIPSRLNKQIYVKIELIMFLKDSQYKIYFA